MGVTGTLIIYSLIGLVVAGARVLGGDRGARPSGLLAVVGALIFWPLFLAVLLGGRERGAAGRPEDRQQPRSETSGAHEPRVRGAEDSLVAALRSLSGPAEHALEPEIARVRALARAISQMGRRLEEMDALLERGELDPAAAEAALRDLAARGAAQDDPRVQSVRARLRNVERMRALRARTSDDFERALLQIEELCSQIHLLRFAGAPNTEVLERIEQIAAGIEGLTEGMLEMA